MSTVKLLLVADLHYTLRQYDWIDSVAEEFDAVVVAGDKLFVSDTQRGRLSRWTLDGRLDWDKQLGIFPGYLIGPSLGLADGSWLMRFRVPRTSTEDGVRWNT